MLDDLRRLPRQVYVLCAGAFINRIGSFVMLFMTLYLREDLGYSVQFSTLCVGAFGFGSIVATLLGGQVADIIGRRVCMQFSLFGGACMLLVLRAVQSPALLLLVLFLFALIAEMYRPASAAMMSDLAPPDLRPFAYSLMYVTVNLGFAFAPPIGGYLSSFSFDLLFWVDAATMAVYGAVISWSVAETNPASDAQRRETILQTLHVYGAILRDRTFFLLFLGAFLTAIVYLQSMSTLPIYMQDCGISKASYGTLIAINGLMIALLQLPLTALLKRFSPMANVVAGSVLIAIGFGMTSISITATAFVVTIVVWTLGEIMQAAFMRPVIAELAAPNVRGRYMGCFGLSWSGALMLGPPLGGWVLDHGGPLWLWGGSFAVALAGACVLQLASRNIDTVDTAAPLATALD